MKISYAPNSKNRDMWNSSSIKNRIDDLHSSFLNKDINGILTSIGGYNTNQILEYIDWELIAKNPKILCGYSDITVLLNAIYKMTGLVTYYGPHFSSFGQKYLDKYTVEYFKKCIFSNKGFNIVSSNNWSDDKWYKDQEDRRYYDNVGIQIMNPGKRKGILLGGTLSVFNLLKGTRYMPSLKGSILLIEDKCIAEEFDRDLQSLIDINGFSYVKGLLIGRFSEKSKIDLDVLKDIIKSKSVLKKIPIVANVDFGHTFPQLTLPIGGEISVDCSGEKILLNVITH